MRSIWNLKNLILQSKHMHSFLKHHFLRYTHINTHVPQATICVFNILMKCMVSNTSCTPYIYMYIPTLYHKNKDFKNSFIRNIVLQENWALQKWSNILQFYNLENKQFDWYFKIKIRISTRVCKTPKPLWDLSTVVTS